MILESFPTSPRLTLYISTGSNATTSFMIVNSTKIESVKSSNVMVWLIGATDLTTSVCVVGPVGRRREVEDVGGKILDYEKWLKKRNVENEEKREGCERKYKVKTDRGG